MTEVFVGVVISTSSFARSARFGAAMSTHEGSTVQDQNMQKRFVRAS